MRTPCACGGTCPHCLTEGKAAATPQSPLPVNEPGDAFEQEADRVADQVLRMPAPITAADPSDDAEMALWPQLQRLSVLQRKCAPESDNKLQRRADNVNGPATAPPIVHEVLRPPGRPLDATTRAFMEPRFGYDFSDVRVHTDQWAAAGASTIQARAYTVGHDIVFSAGQYAPGTAEGRRLLAHELTHVAQQSDEGRRLQRKIKIGTEQLTVDDQFERTVSSMYGATGLEIVFAMDNDGKPPDYSFKGWEEFSTELKVRSRAVAGIDEITECCGFPDDKHPGGRLDATYWDKKGPFHFQAKSLLPEGKEASDAIEAIFKPDAHTMLECYTMAQAVEYRSLLKALRKDKFNELFPGGVGLMIKIDRVTAGVADEITISGGTGPTAATLMDQGKLEKMYNVPKSELIPGDWVYFKNFKNYLRKHPNGLFQGENAFYIGNGRFQGLGVEPVDEDGMLDALVDAYNEDLPKAQQKTKRDLIREGGGFNGQVWRPVIDQIVTTPAQGRGSAPGAPSAPTSAPASGPTSGTVAGPTLGPASAPAPAPAPAGGPSDEMLRQIARQLREAMEGWGTDEDSIYAALSGRTPDQVSEIGRVYNEMYKRDLQADLQDELSDSELKHLASVMGVAPSKAGATASEQAGGDAEMALSPHLQRQSVLQRKCAPESNDKLQRRADNANGPATAPPIVREVLRSPGRPLDAATRAFMEPRFGHDFGNVRVHADAKATASARAVNALAYTVGDRVVFGEGQFAPTSAIGQRMLAHELTHVVQQSHGNARRLVRQSNDADTPTPGIVTLPEVAITAERHRPGSWPTSGELELDGCKGRARFEASETPSGQWLRNEGDYPQNMTKRGYTFWYRIPRKNGGTLEFWTNISNPADCRWVVVMLSPPPEKPQTPSEEQQAPSKEDVINDDTPPPVREAEDATKKCISLHNEAAQIRPFLRNLRRSGEGHSPEYEKRLIEFETKLKALEKMVNEFKSSRESWKKELELTSPGEIGKLEYLGCQGLYDELKGAYEDFKQNRDSPVAPTPIEQTQPSDDQDQAPPEQEELPPEVPSDPSQDENDAMDE